MFTVSGQNGFPKLVNGPTVEFAQGALTVQMDIRGVQQTVCLAAPAVCSPATTCTATMPFELIAESRDAAVLRVRENASIVAEVAINAVTDSVHVINTCDQTGIFISAASSVRPGVCAPVVMHARGPLVSESSPDSIKSTFVVPEAPADLGFCSAGRGNLRVSVSGPASADVAEICLSRPVVRVGISDEPFAGLH